MRNRITLAVFAASSLLGLSSLSAAPVIQRGIDVFTTVGKGRTSYDFAQKPIPSGFFCEGSRAFTGKVDFKGLPLATEIPGQLRGADTLIERLDDSPLDARGVGRTRIQFRALSLVSEAPIKTSCGDFHVYVSLAGKQRVTSMKIYRTQEGGGSFIAPLAVNLRMLFIPVKAQAKRAKDPELTVGFTFDAKSLPWSFNDGAKGFGAVKVDTNGDLIPDTVLTGSSNFSPARLPEHRNAKWRECPPCAVISCHEVGSEDEHCYMEPPPNGCPDMMICE